MTYWAECSVFMLPVFGILLMLLWSLLKLDQGMGKVNKNEDYDKVWLVYRYSLALPYTEACLSST